MKRWFLRLISAAFAASFLNVFYASAAAYKTGDVSRNGAIDDFDARLLQIGLLQGSFTDAVPLVCVDPNNDRIMNAADLSLVKQMVMKPASASPQPQTKKLIWSDEFSLDSVSTSNWSFDTGNWMFDDYGNYITGGWGNDEQQYYTQNNAAVHDGILTITAKQEQYSDPVQGNYSYTSARMTSKDKFSFCGGRVEVRARCDLGKSLWPAIWMLPEDSAYGAWAASGEIDIMEARGSDPYKVSGSIHFGDAWPNNRSLTEEYTITDNTTIYGWHTYAIEWQRDAIRWYVDDELYSTQTDWYSVDRDAPAPFDQNFYLILNLAVGGNFDGVDGKYADPATFADGEKHFEIDYVRVYDMADGFKPTVLKSALMDSYFKGCDADVKRIGNKTICQIHSTGSYPYGLMELISGQSVKAGETHTLMFDAVSSVGRQITVTAEDSEYKRYLDQTIEIGTVPKHFRFNVTVPSDMTLDIKFLLGDIGGASKLGEHTVTLSNVKWT